MQTTTSEYYNTIAGRPSAKRKNAAYARAFANQIDVANMRSATMVTMHDDGYTRDKDSSAAEILGIPAGPRPGRYNLARKLAIRDEHGDPVFCLPTMYPALALREQGPNNGEALLFNRAPTFATLSNDPSNVVTEKTEREGKTVERERRLTLGEVFDRRRQQVRAEAEAARASASPGDEGLRQLVHRLPGALQTAIESARRGEDIVPRQPGPDVSQLQRAGASVSVTTATGAKASKARHE